MKTSTNRGIVLAMSLEAEMLRFIKMGLDDHASHCPLQPKAVLLNPGNHELFGWDELYGIPVLPDERVQPQRFRIDCDGSAFGLEGEMEELLTQPAPGQPIEVPVPVGPGGPGEPGRREYDPR